MEDQEIEYRKAIADHRQLLVNQECESSHLLDNSITLVSTGALVVSLSLIDSVMPYLWLLKTSWILLLLSIGCQMFSYWTSERAFKKQREIIDTGDIEKARVETKWSKATGYLNIVLRILFTLGLAALVIYGFMVVK